MQDAILRSVIFLLGCCFAFVPGLSGQSSADSARWNRGEELLTAAKVAYNEGRYDTANILLDQVDATFADLPSGKLSAETLRAVLMSVSGQFDPAISRLSSVIETLSDSIPRGKSSIANARLSLAFLQTRAGRYADVHATVQKAFEHPPNDSIMRGRLLSQLAWNHVMLDQNIPAISAGNEALELLLSKRDSLHSSVAGVYQVLGYAYRWSGQHSKALPYFELCLKSAQAGNVPNDYNIALSYNDLAGQYTDMELYDLALNQYQEAYDIMLYHYEHQGNSSGLSMVLNNLAYVYQKLGESELAIESTKKGLVLKSENYGDNNPQQIQDLVSLGYSLVNIDEYNKAVSYADSALHLHQTHHPDDRGQLIYINGLFISIYEKQEEYDRVIELTNTMRAYQLDKGEFYNKFNYINACQLASAHIHLGHIELADDAIKEARVIVDSIYAKTHSQYYYYLLVESEKAEANKDDQGAKHWLERFALLQGGDRKANTVDLSEAKTSKQMWSMILNLMPLYSRLIESGDMTMATLDTFYMGFEKYFDHQLVSFRSAHSVRNAAKLLRAVYAPGIRYWINEGSQDGLMHALVLNEKYRGLQKKVIDSHSPSDLKVYSLLQRIDDIQHDIDSLIALSSLSSDLNLGDYKEVVQARESRKQLYDSIKAINADGVLATSIKSDKAIDAIRSGLKDDEALVQFVQLDTLLYVIYQLGADQTLYQHLSSTQLVDSILYATRGDHHRQVDSDSAYADVVAQLLPSALFGIKHWLVIPEGSVSYINLEALIKPNGRYIGQDHVLRYASSIYQSLPYERDINGEQIISYTPVFDWSEAQATSSDDTIRRIVHQPFMARLISHLSQYNDSRHYVKGEATETQFMSDNTACKVLHLNSHGEVSDMSPLYSQFLLVPDSLNDGVVHMYDILRKRYDAELAILSACNTGQGQYKTGEGVLSMAYAFFYAGCPSVVMTLWETDEEATAEILGYFYTHLASGKTKSLALHHAKLDYLAHCIYDEQKDPYYWAGLVLYGDDRPIDLDDGSMKCMWWWLGAIGLVAFFLVYRWRRKPR